MFKLAPAALITAAAGLSLAGSISLSQAATPEIVTLTQTACQFIESENGVDHGYQSSKKADCEAINKTSETDRLKEAKTLTLKKGSYIFRVNNADVPYELGFWLREKDYDWRNPLHKLSKISVSGGGLTQGKTQDYAVDLEPGEYLYSCPLNITPSYKLIVTE